MRSALRRRRLSLLALALLAWPGLAFAAPPPVVTMLGDSITAGYGLRAADALPAQLQAALARLGVRTVVRGAGVSGDTSAGALARVGFSVQSDTRVCVVEIGGNDFLQSIPPAQTEANLRAIIAKLQARGIMVVLASARLPARAAGDYGRDFAAIYPRVARATHAKLSPDLLAGVFGVPAMLQADGLHPDPAGVRLVSARLAPVVAAALRR